MSLFLYLTRLNPAKHIMHISLAAHVVAAKLPALALWRAHLIAKKALLLILAAYANPAQI